MSSSTGSKSTNSLTAVQKKQLRDFITAIENDADSYEFVEISNADKMRALIALEKQKPEKCVVSGGSKTKKNVNRTKSKRNKGKNTKSRKNKSSKIKMSKRTKK